MNARSRLRSASLFVVAGLWAGAGPAVAQIHVGRPVQVSAARAGEPHYEVLAAAHPVDRRRLLVGSMLQPSGSGMTSGSIAYVSDDGGATWRPTLEAPPIDFRTAASGDPAVAFGPDGSAWFVASLIPPNADRASRSMLLYRSADGGSTWAEPSRFTYSDREYITVDGTGGPYHGRIYVNGNGRIGGTAGHLTAFRSTDAGRTFVEAAMPSQPVAPVMGNAVVLSDGVVIALHSAEDVGVGGKEAQSDRDALQDAMRVRLRVSASRDGGQSFASPRDVAVATMASGRKGGHNNISNLPSIAVDGSGGAYRDRLYVVWPELESDGTSIRIALSSDRGLTWSGPAVVSDARTPGRDHFMPAVAVNRNGVVGVMWYDRRDRSDDLGWDVRFAASLDGGTTFLPSVRVSGGGTRFGEEDEWVVESRASTSSSGESTLDLSLNTFSFLGGDTAGLVADAAGVFHPVWVDNSSGLPQVWTARVSAGPRDPPGADAAANGRARDGVVDHRVSDSSRSASGDTVTPSRPILTRSRVAMGTRRDVTKQVTLEATSPRYDRASGTLTVRVRLFNESTEPVRGPIVLSAGAVRSELGNATAANPDFRNDEARGWLFGAGSEEWLQPGAYTEPRVLAFRLTALRAFREGNRFLRGLASFSWTASVY